MKIIAVTLIMLLGLSGCDSESQPVYPPPPARYSAIGVLKVA
jgi:uncharacterized protein YceK